MKRFFFILCIVAGTVSAWAVDLPKIGRIDYVEGGVSIGRTGKTIRDPNIDDPLLSGDLIKTAGDGLLVISLDKNTGMGGTVTVRARSSLYLKIESVKGEPKTSFDILTGSIGSKVSKLAGAPSMNVTTNGAVMGVRGTQFEVAVSVNESILVTCVEGQVAASDGKEELPVGAGKVLEKRPGEKLRYVPVAISSVKDYREKWIADEIEAFKADAPRALAAYEKRYSDLAAKFATAYDAFQKSPTLRKWLDEDRAGTKTNPLDAAVMREKKEMAGYLLNIRKILFVFERIYMRVDELTDIVKGTVHERKEIKKGLTIGDFLKRVKDESDGLARKVALFRYTESLYAQRNPDSELMSEGDDDFFGSSDGF